MLVCVPRKIRTLAKYVFNNPIDELHTG